jgi:N-acetyl-gamma-glutamyl-phosphate reductase
MVKAGIVGATGFTGEKIAEILWSHPEAELSYISAMVEKEEPFSEIFPRFKKKINTVCKNLDINQAVNLCEVVFLALPHTVSFKIAPAFLRQGKKVIDLSADYRLKDTAVYEKFYNTPHADKENLAKAVYGLPEFYRDEIRKADLIANPGCYPTASVLCLAPLLKEDVGQNVIIDAKTGITGAGRRPSLTFNFSNLSGNMFGYRLFSHQHLPEINDILTRVSGKTQEVIFTPHVIPVERGIFLTVYADLKKKMTKLQILDIYKKHYADKPFVRIFEKSLPNLKDVVETNFCDIGFEVSGNKLIIVAAIDNLLKGAGGQAVQNMNIMLGLEEELGLK